jgi:competence ComEA-like helix-hairpin-helix protein
MLAAFSPLVSAQDGLPAGKGKTAFVRVCGACHGFDEITSLRMQKAGWETIVNDMITRGATGTDEEMAQALDYLANNFGVVVKVNQATVEEIRSGLGLARKDAEAIVKVRVEKGSFKGLADLLKVPGIDRARIEEQKGNLVF